MLRPLALLKGYMFLLVRDETFCIRRTKTFTQNKTTGNIRRKGWRAEGLVCGSEANMPMRGGRHCRKTTSSRGDNK